MCLGLVLSTVSECYIVHGRSLGGDPEFIEATAVAAVNVGLDMMGSDYRVEKSTAGISIHHRGIGLPPFTGKSCIWDHLGLAREVDVPGQSWNPNGMSTFFNKLDFADFRYWDAIFWRTGGLDRHLGRGVFSFVEKYDARVSQGGYQYEKARAKFLADYSDRGSLWFRLARQWRMRDHMILVFETTRTRSIETVDLPEKHDIREQYHSADPHVSMTARLQLAALDMGIPEIEAVLGRPYYELMLGSFIPGSPTDMTVGLNQSVSAVVDDIMTEAASIMSVLHVRPYLLWTSETELMIAAARPGSKLGPWSRLDVEEMCPLLSSVHGTAVGGDTSPLMEWSNSRRTAYEPGYSWTDVEVDDACLNSLLKNRPDLEHLLNSGSWHVDDKVLMHRLVRLGRFGYGLPQVRKPEYRDVHLLP